MAAQAGAVNIDISYQQMATMITDRDKLLVDPDRIAVLVIDMHKGHLGEQDPRDALCPTLLGRTIIPALEAFLDDARTLSIPLIFVRFTARHNFVDCKMKFWCSDKVLSGVPRFHELNVEPVPDDWWIIRPRPDDYTVTSKKRYSAFYGTDLEILLRRLGTDTVVLTGIDTDVCVLSTGWDSVNRDFLTFILRDCTHCSSEEDKQAALRIMDRWVGWVMDSREFLNMIKERQAQRHDVTPGVNTGVYVAMKIGSKSKRCLQQITNHYTIPNMISFSKLHVTIVFSRKYDHIVPNSANRFKGIITGYKVFLTRDGKNGLVVELDSKDMLNRHKELMSMYDLTYEFDTFIPHFTLSYDVGDNFDVTQLPIPSCPIVVESEYVEPLDLDWANKP